MPNDIYTYGYQLGNWLPSFQVFSLSMHMLIQSTTTYYDTTVDGQDLYLRAYEVEASRIAGFCTYFYFGPPASPPPLQYNSKRLIT